MSKVSPFSPFRLEDFPNQRDWIGTLFLPLNQTLEQVCQALNGQVTAGDNIPTFTKVITGSNLTLPMTFKMGTFSPTQMVVAQAVKAGSPIAMVGAWSVSGDTITVSKLYEVSEAGNAPVSSGTKYTIALKFT